MEIYDPRNHTNEHEKYLVIFRGSFLISVPHVTNQTIAT